MNEIVRVARPESWRRDFVSANNGRCHYCNRTGHAGMGPDDRPWHVDHMNPLARGGKDEESNLTLACKRCNLTKSAQPYAQFKEFARAAFWVPNDWRASEFELDRLVSLYHETADDGAKEEPEESEPESLPVNSTWHADEDGFTIVYTGRFGKEVQVLKWAGDVASNRDPISRGKYDRQIDATARTHVDLVVLMRRLLPSLVAEIRMLRADEQDAENLKREDAA